MYNSDTGNSNLSPRSELSKFQIFGVLPLPYDITPIVWYKGEKESYLKVSDKNGIFFFIHFTAEEAGYGLSSTLNNIKIDIVKKDKSPILQSIREGSFRSVSDLIVGVVLEGVDGISVIYRKLIDVVDIWYQYSIDENVNLLPNKNRYPAYPIIRYKLINDNRAIDRIKLANKTLFMNHKKNYIHHTTRLLNKYKNIYRNFNLIKKNLETITHLPYYLINNKKRDDTYRETVDPVDISYLNNLLDELNIEMKYIVEKINEMKYQY